MKGFKLLSHLVFVSSKGMMVATGLYLSSHILSRDTDLNETQFGGFLLRCFTLDESKSCVVTCLFNERRVETLD